MSEIFNPFSLEGKTILVTGASSGIGRETAVVCSKMGAEVVLTARNTERLEQTLSMMAGSNHKIITADVTVQEDVDRIAAEVPALNGVVHCAGVGDRTLLKMVREKDIERVMKANFNAPVLLQRALLKKKKIQSQASIVLIASRAPFAPAPGNGIYAASKGALLAYAKVLGLELASQTIRVNSVCPAMVWTDLVQRDAEINGVDYSLVEQSYPLKRFGKPEDIANLVVYLLSDASEWMTGSSIDITGGGEFTLS